MDSNDFNDMPKDALVVISDMPKFVEFVVYHSITKAVKKILFTLFENKNYAVKMVEKYALRYSSGLKDFAKIESEKYIVKNIEVDGEDVGKEFFNELGIVGEIKRGDIDRIVIKSSHNILYSILTDMTKDKLIKLCWDSENNDFVWMLRQPNEPDKVETQYKPKKRTTKKQK